MNPQSDCSPWKLEAYYRAEDSCQHLWFLLYLMHPYMNTSCSKTKQTAKAENIIQPCIFIPCTDHILPTPKSWPIAELPIFFHNIFLQHTALCTDFHSTTNSLKYRFALIQNLILETMILDNVCSLDRTDRIMIVFHFRWNRQQKQFFVKCKIFSEALSEVTFQSKPVIHHCLSQSTYIFNSTSFVFLHYISRE